MIICWICGRMYPVPNDEWSREVKTPCPQGHGKQGGNIASEATAPTTQERDMQNVLNLQDAINDLKEVRAEITRVNRAAGRTVFNPAATSALEQVMEYLKDAETA